MADETQQVQEPRIERAVTRLSVPSDRGIIVFDASPVGPNTYQELGKAIIGRGQAVPSGHDSIYLAHTAYCSKLKGEPECERVRQIMNGNYLYAFDNTLTTEDGVFFVYDPSAEGLQRALTIEGLESRLSGVKEDRGLRVSADGTVAFAQKGENFDIGYQDVAKLGKNRIVAAYCKGWDGVQKAVEVASTFKRGDAIRQPYVGLVEVRKGGKPVTRVSGLGEYWCGGRLGVDGDFVDYGGFGFALGVLK